MIEKDKEKIDQMRVPFIYIIIYLEI